ncbi:hypothetical protein M947_05250 [Sulfurimonas hongkongensis]|uniref:Biopolymer transporter ExbD n=1 Tax=Sulfurimonas hongkongensis TaxID=1172190 RepID=T0JS53_9BACT|nr:biopolymer transporter ExbD [Sulfurimonas hongkongensis]EQB39732.1 hypothetical protein M947_05250 [Sulfurimonas hongkongensis]
MKRREPLGLDMTPVVDIVFILLIFFLVSSVFKKEELALMLELPKAGASKEVKEEKTINIELSKDSLAVNGKKVSYEEIIAEILPLVKEEKLIMFYIDRDVPYSRVIGILDLLKKHSLNKLALVTKEE